MNTGIAAAFRLFARASLTASLAGCSGYDHVNTRGMAMNVSIGNYDNDATLLNIVRASSQEPLELTNLSAIKGYNNFSVAVGLPTITVGPHGAGALGGARDYGFGTNSITYASNNDFGVGIIDDPSSYQALLTPLSPATIGFFVGQGYPRELLFFLLIERIRVETGSGTGQYVEYRNDLFDPATMQAHPEEQQSFEDFLNTVEDWIRDGLTVQIDRSAVPGQKSIPAHRICFDQHLRLDVTSQEAASPTPAPGSDCATDSNWTAAISLDATPAKASDKPAPKTSGAPVVAASYEPAWRLTLPDGRKAALFTRSVFAIYHYLGDMIDRKIRLGFLKHSDDADTRLLDWTNDTTDCFAETEYRGVRWCIPNGARNTKRVFSLLRQLLRLNATPSVQPQTATVRVE